MKPSSLRSLFRLLGVAALAVAMQGCGMIYKTTGDVLVSYGKSAMMPYVMTQGDVGMACALGLATTPLLMSFQTVGSEPKQLAPMVYTTAATCSDTKKLEAQLHYMRAIRAGNVSAAQDARIMQKRWAAVSAKRQLIAYNSMLDVYGPMKNGQCPELEDDFDQLVWLIGNLSGLQALLNDTTAGGAVGVPRNIAANAADAATCVDSAKWWGVPKGMQASVWVMLPMLAPEGATPWKMLQQSAQIGFSKGVRLSSALYAMAAYSKGDDKRLKQAIRDFAANSDHVNPSYRQIDAIAKSMILGLSDRLWTKATGKRTPYGELGTFWDDPKLEPKIDIQSLLN